MQKERLNKRFLYYIQYGRNISFGILKPGFHMIVNVS